MIELPTPADTRALGQALGEVLEPGDLVVLEGPLGAGKTVVAQGIGAGLGVPGRVVSPTFVLARVHRGGRVPLVHVDAYRLGSVGEIDDMDLDADLADSVTVVEWGHDMVEHLADAHLVIRLSRSETDDTRTAELLPHGGTWPERVAALRRISLVLGDITEQHVDVVVNAANSSLLGGSGVDGAIHRRGGPTILAECRDLRARQYGGGLPTGDAVATTAGELPARWVVHTVGPVWTAEEDRSDLLHSCYLRSLERAAELGARTIAFPAISAGAYGWPMDDAARVAVAAVRSAPASTVDEVRFVLFNDVAYTAFEAALGAAYQVGP